MKKLFMIVGLLLAFTITTNASEPVKASTTSTTLAVVAVASPASTVTPEPKALSVVKKIDKAIPADLAVWIIAALAFLAELLMRVFPTVKPKSLLLLVSAIFVSIGSIFSKLSGLLDKIAQNIKEPKEEEKKA